MYKTYGIYEESTGMIVATQSFFLKTRKKNTDDPEPKTPEEMVYLEPGQGFAEFYEDQDAWYRDVAMGQWAKKTPCPLQISVGPYVVGQPIALSGIPAPCQLRIDNIPYPVDTPEIDIEFDTPGRHTLVLQCAKHFKMEMVLDVEA